MENEKSMPPNSVLLTGKVLNFFGAIYVLAEIAFLCVLIIALIAFQIHSGISMRDVLKIAMLLLGAALFAIAFYPKSTRRITPGHHPEDE